MCAVYNLVVCPICGILRVKSYEGEPDSPCRRCLDTEQERCAPYECADYEACRAGTGPKCTMPCEVQRR